MTLLRIDDLSVRLPRRTSHSGLFSAGRDTRVAVLDGLSLSIDDNDFLAVLGPSGSGKTTLLKTIAGLIEPDGGRIFFGETDLGKFPPHRRRLSMVLQNGGWYDHLTVEQNLKLEDADTTQVDELLHRFGLAEYRCQYPSQLSGGQTQRLALARAVLRRHDLILLDEPLSRLDQASRHILREIMLQLHRDGKTLIYVTHDQHDAMSLATRIAVLHTGRIQQIGSPEEIYLRPNHRAVAESLGHPSMQFFDVENVEAFRTACVERFGASSELSRFQLGIRPEAWRIDIESNETVSKSRLAVKANRVSSRILGSQRLQVWHTHKLDRTDLTIQRLASRDMVGPEADHGLCLSVMLSEVHWFDRESGNRIAIGS